MMKRIFQAFALFLAAGLAYLSFDYWQDPVYWRRWADLFSNPDPAHMNFKPVEIVDGGGVFEFPRATDANRSIDPAAIAEAEAYAAEYESFALIVLHKGVVQSEWYNDGWTPDRITQSQSMHKSIAALMLGAAIEEGSVGPLETPVKTYLPEWQDDPRGDITLRQLIVMSSGLAKYEFTLNPFNKNSSFRFLNSADRTPILLKTALEWEPGSKFDYNDVNAALVGLIIERATGKSYGTFLQEKLWIPMGGQEAQVWLDQEDGLAMTACCLLAPAMDWVRMGAMMKDGGRINGNQIVSSEFIDDMITADELNPRYGYFTWLGREPDAEAGIGAMEISQSEPYAADDVFMFLGYGGQRMYASRDKDLVVVRLGPHSGYMPLKPGWDNAFLFNRLARGILPETEVPPEMPLN